MPLETPFVWTLVNTLISRCVRCLEANQCFKVQNAPPRKCTVTSVQKEMPPLSFHEFSCSCSKSLTLGENFVKFSTMFTTNLNEYHITQMTLVPLEIYIQQFNLFWNALKSMRGLAPQSKQCRHTFQDLHLFRDAPVIQFEEFFSL